MKPTHWNFMRSNGSTRDLWLARKWERLFAIQESNPRGYENEAGNECANSKININVDKFHVMFPCRHFERLIGHIGAPKGCCLSVHRGPPGMIESLRDQQKTWLFSDDLKAHSMSEELSLVNLGTGRVRHRDVWLGLRQQVHDLSGIKIGSQQADECFGLTGKDRPLARRCHLQIVGSGRPFQH